MIGYPDFTQGFPMDLPVFDFVPDQLDSATIGKNGKPLSISDHLRALQALSLLVTLKRYKEEHGKDVFYLQHRDSVWDFAKECFDK